MVKSPKIRHSKPSGEPLTIDLSKDDVKRVEAEQTVEKPAQAEGAAATKASGDAAAKPAAAEPKPAGASAFASSASASGPKVAASTGFSPQPEKPATAFGRDGGKTDAAGPAKGSTTAQTPPPRNPQPAAPAAAPRRTGTALFAGLLGGVIALGGAGAAWYAGLIQPPVTVQPAPPAVVDTSAVDSLRNEVESLRAALEELRAAPPPAAEAPDLSGVDARIEGLATLVEDLRAQLAALGENNGAAAGDPAAIDALRTALAALEARVAALPADGGAALGALREEIGGAVALARQASDAAAQATSAAGALAPRLDRIESELATLASEVAEAAEKPGVALAIAASALKAAVDRGMPFATELDTYAGLAPDTPEIAALRPFAATGVPTRVDIEARFDAAASAMIAAGRAEDPNAGFMDKLWSSALSVVEVRPIGEVQGADPAAVVARMEVALGRGDYARAIAEFDALPQRVRDAGADFMERVRARHAADDLVAKMLAAALRA